MKLVRVTGHCPSPSEFAENTAPVELIAWAKTKAEQNWEWETDYVFEVALTPTNLRVWVDGVLEFDVDREFTEGRFAFWTGWQPFVCYKAPLMLCTCPCDMNCDGSVDITAVEPFIKLILGSDEPCGIGTGDTNYDGSVDLQDVQGFLDCLLG